MEQQNLLSAKDVDSRNSVREEPKDGLGQGRCIEDRERYLRILKSLAFSLSKP